LPIASTDTWQVVAHSVSLPLPASSNIHIARFFQGFGVSPAATVGMAIINDLFFEHERGQKIGLWVLALDMGLLFGPLSTFFFGGRYRVSAD
jgi:MFS family permease